MTIPQVIEQIVFYFSAIMIVICAIMVVAQRNTVRGALFLVLAFVFTSVLWILLEAEFLALALIFVYVGAVMTLFLFVVMMLDIRIAPTQRIFVRYLPIGLLVSAVILALLIYVAAPEHFGVAKYAVPFHASANYSNVKALGSVLYTDFLYPFELAAVILLVAIVGAICLAMPVVRSRKRQRPEHQIRVRRDDRIRLLDMASEKKID